MQNCGIKHRRREETSRGRVGSRAGKGTEGRASGQRSRSRQGGVRVTAEEDAVGIPEDRANRGEVQELHKFNSDSNEKRA